MKTIKIYLEDAGVVATPGNTIGMGNPMPPTDTQMGSEPMSPTASCDKGKCKKRKKKTLKESLLDDENVLMDETGNKMLIEKFIKDNYIIIKGNIKINKDYTVDCSGDVVLRDWASELTNGMFTWGIVNGNFCCSDCYDLKSLKGGPKKVKGYFVCNDCYELISLEGAPEFVGKFFNCERCETLTSLKGGPKQVEGNYICSYCKKLKSFAGAPKKVGGEFTCYDSGISESNVISEISKYSNIKGNIYY